MVYGPQNGRRSKDSRSIVFSSKFIRIVSEIVNFILLSPVTVNLNSKCQIEEREQLLDMCYIILAYGVFPNVKHVFYTIFRQNVCIRTIYELDFWCVKRHWQYFSLWQKCVGCAQAFFDKVYNFPQKMDLLNLLFLSLFFLFWLTNFEKM